MTGFREQDLKLKPGRESPAVDHNSRPEWIVEKVSNQFGLTCPWDGCGEKMLVNRRAWLKGRIPPYYDLQKEFSALRACAYCIRLSRIPSRLLPKK